METTHSLCKTSRIPRLSRLPRAQEPFNFLSQDPFSSSLVSKQPSPSIEPKGQINQDTSVKGGETSPSRSRRNPNVESSRDGNEDPSCLSRTMPARRRPRPSLSDRTAETLAQMPLSKSPKRRRSSFFHSNGPMSSPIRPATSMARARPSTSMGLRPSIPDFSLNARPSSPTKPRLTPVTGNRLPPRTPSKADAGQFIPRSLPPPRPGSKAAIHLTPSKSKSSATSIRYNNHRPNFGQ